MKKLIGYATRVALCLALAACGGGGGGGGSSTTSVASIAGTVIDGYIEGATVCLDLNANQACDSNEPSATTNAIGAFTLNTSSLTLAQVRTAHILVVVPSAAKDLDDGGQTLTQAGKKPFWLLAPTNAYVTSGGTVSGTAVVSPFTTLVSHAMLVNPGTTLDDAQSVIRTQLTLSSSTDLHQNFVSTSNASLQSKARTIAYLIGKVSDGATSVGSATTRERILGALHYVRAKAATVQTIVDADSSNSTIATKVDAAIATAGLSPDYANLVAQAKELTSVEAANYATILSSGVYIQSCFLNPNCNFSMYGKLTGQSTQVSIAYYSESSNAWVPYTVNNTIRRLGSAGWEAPPFSSTFPYTAIDSVSVEASGPWGGVSTKGTLGELDLSNKTSADIPGTWSKNSTDLKTITFPSGSKVYISRGAPTADQYTLWLDYPYTSGPTGSRAHNSSYTSLVDLIADHQTTGATNTSKHLSWSDIIVTFDSYAASGTATLWNDTNYPCVRTVSGYSCGGGSPSFTKIGTVPYETRSVAGTSILVIFAQSSVDEAGYPMYSARSGNVYRGIFAPKGHAYNSTLYFNRTAYDAILASWSKPAVLN